MGNIHDLTLFFAMPFNSGECNSSSSKDVRLELNDLLRGTGKHGRKVDLMFHRQNLELSNLEFKTIATSDMEMKSQLSKNIRLNRAVMEASRPNQ